MADAPGHWPLDALTRAGAAVFPGFRAEAVPSVDSTNTELMRRARAGRLSPTLLVAEVQTAGRGRLGRPWVSGARVDGASRTGLQALTFSLGLCLAPRDWSGLSLAVGVSVARALHPALQLKWPNDLWLDGRKLGGILIETAQLGEERCAVIGVGINLQPPDAAGLSVPPACLQELLPGCDAATALQRIVPDLLAALRTFEAFGLAPFQHEFHARDLLRGRWVVLSDGSSGTAQGIDAGGGLLVHTPAGMTTVTSSEVSVRPAPAAVDRGR
jgi:BirA family transcriptional regulator, biotin operon repressor / biotin---[acetyl-CoA-carboxylase] ligase